MSDEMPAIKMDVEQKLSINKYELDEESHIKIDQEVCRTICQTKVCLFICPAKVYTQRGDEIVADHAGCLECGTCSIVCPESALHWHYPRGSLGVIYRYA